MDPACAQVPGWVGPDYTAAIQEEDVTFAFGVAVRCRLLTCYLLLSTHITHYLHSVGGLLGVLCGMGLSVLLRPRLPWIDPVICGTSLLVSNIYTISTLYLQYLHYLLYISMSR